MLVEGGADINYKFPNGETPAVDILSSSRTATIDKFKVLEYLIVDKYAVVNQPYYVGENKEEVQPVEELRTWVFDLDSDEYKIKRDIIKEFERQGVDYYSVPVLEDILEYIKEKYPDTWEDYLKVY